jgi:hypothetical protein
VASTSWCWAWCRRRLATEEARTIKTLAAQVLKARVLAAQILAAQILAAQILAAERPAGSTRPACPAGRGYPAKTPRGR